MVTDGSTDLGMRVSSKPETKCPAGNGSKEDMDSETLEDNSASTQKHLHTHGTIHNNTTYERDKNAKNNELLNAGLSESTENQLNKSKNVLGNNQEEVFNHPDVDGGWAWVVGFGMAAFYFIVGGFFRSFGVVFAAILEQFEESASVTSLVPGVRAATLIVVGPASTILSQRLSERVVMVTGALVVSLGFVLSFFAKSVEFLIFSIGMTPGIGTSLLIGPGNIMLTKYFRRRRATAVTVTSSMGCIGQIIVPLLMVRMIEVYSIQGSLLIFGGVTLNVILTGMVMRPIDLEKGNKNKATYNASESDKGTGTTEERAVIIEGLLPGAKSKEYPAPTLGTADVRSKTNVINFTEKIEKEAAVSSTQSVSYDDQQRSELPYGCPADKGDLPYFDNSDTDKISIKTTTALTVDIENDSEVEPLNPESLPVSKDTPPKKTFFRAMLTFIHDMYPLELLLNLDFCLLFITSILSLVTMACQQIYLFVTTESLGFSREQSAMFLSIFGLADMIGRLSSGQLADRKFLQTQHIMAGCCLVSGLAFCFITFATSLYSMIPLIIVIGLCINVTLVMMMPEIITSLGVEIFPKAFSMVLGFHGLAMTITPSIFGLIVDTTGSYDVIFPIGGCLQLLGGVLLVVRCIIHNRRQNRDREASY